MTTELKRQKLEELSKLQNAVLEQLQTRRSLESDLEKLEFTNHQITSDVDKVIKTRRSQEGKIAADASEIEKVDKLTALLATGSFLVAANTTLRSNLCDLLEEQKKISLELTDLRPQDKAEIDWVIKAKADTMPHSLIRNPFKRLKPADLLKEWKTRFGGGDAKTVEDTSRIEEVSDSLQANRTLHSECETKLKYQSSDDLVADAMDNYGFRFIKSSFEDNKKIGHASDEKKQELTVDTTTGGNDSNSPLSPSPSPPVSPLSVLPSPSASSSTSQPTGGGGGSGGGTADVEQQTTGSSSSSSSTPAPLSTTMASSQSSSVVLDIMGASSGVSSLPSPNAAGSGTTEDGKESKERKGKGAVMVELVIDPAEMDKSQFPYAYDEEDAQDNIVADLDEQSSNGASGPKRIKCATLNKLIERLTHEKNTDLNTRYVFLLTYHSFTTPRQLLDLLARRYDVPIPPNMTHQEIQSFKATKLDRIQIRVCSVLKNWLDEHFNDFADDLVLKAQLRALIANMLEKSASVLSTQLAQKLGALLKRKEKSEGRRLLQSTNYPKPLISNKLTLETLKFDEVNELEIARQLTIMDFEKFRSIQPRECLGQAWSKKDKAERAPNIIAMIEQFNKVTTWVQLTIVSEADLHKRAAVFKRFVKIATKCRELNNFNSLFAIYCGLTANPIHRLKRTKETVNAKFMKKLDEFRELFKGDKNSRNFRRVLQTTLTPCIPHLGIFLSDLTFTEDGNPDELLGMINFQKRAKLAERIRWIKQYQQEGYQLEPVEIIQLWFRKTFRIVDADTLYKMSKEVEETMVDPTS